MPIELVAVLFGAQDAAPGPIHGIILVGDHLDSGAVISVGRADVTADRTISNAPIVHFDGAGTLNALAQETMSHQHAVEEFKPQHYAKTNGFTITNPEILGDRQDSTTRSLEIALGHGKQA